MIGAPRRWPLHRAPPSAACSCEVCVLVCGWVRLLWKPFLGLLWDGGGRPLLLLCKEKCAKSLFWLVALSSVLTGLGCKTTCPFFDVPTSAHARGAAPPSSARTPLWMQLTFDCVSLPCQGSLTLASSPAPKMPIPATRDPLSSSLGPCSLTAPRSLVCCEPYRHRKSVACVCAIVGRVQARKAANRLVVRAYCARVCVCAMPAHCLMCNRPRI